MRQYSQQTPLGFNFSIFEISFQSNTVFYPSGPVFTYDLSPYTMPTLTVTQCSFYAALQSDGTCSQNCLTTLCEVCQTVDSKYFNLCRFCDPTSTSCLASYGCPTDYYMEYGICYNCPPGCSACTNSTNCTGCD